MASYGFVIDQDSCIGCHACTVACKTEHQVPLGVNRTWVKYVEKGAWPDTSRHFSVMRCNHCANAPCVAICPTQALFTRKDGIVDFDTDRCIGCKSCMQACPYDALYIDPDEHTAQKCNYCVHRVEVGLEPACVVVCPEQAIIAGDLHDPLSRIARMVASEDLAVRAPEQGTNPKLWYRGADQASLDPLMSELRAGSQIWRDDPDPAPAWLRVDLTPAHADGPTGPIRIDRSDEVRPRVVYNTDHPMPWGWRVSSYFLTKGIAAGLAIVMALVLVAGGDPTDSALGMWLAPLVSGVFLAATGALLVWDLKRPDRFFYLLTKGNRGSWLVRGAWILGAHAALVGLWFLAGVGGFDDAVRVLTWASAAVGVATAGYTALLFGQAEARDLWQSPTLLWHMVAGAVAAGGAAGLVLALVVQTPQSSQRVFAWALVGGAMALGAIAAAELASHHPTRNITQAMHHLTKGAFARQWWLGGQLLGVAVPILAGSVFLSGGPVEMVAIGCVAVWAGIWFADDAFVKAGQSVPLS
ncbi:MAG TPA: 4Fe-4S dicluster domain-containing protein [Acidimicrobiia bacterium]|nr:4Fe-4S dicluster domain-containing protein [Acidimicrobiia bacterium]